MGLFFGAQSRDVGQLAFLLDMPHLLEQVFVVLISLGIGVRLRWSGFDGSNVFSRKSVIPGASQNKILVPVIGDEARVNVCRLDDVNVWRVGFAVQRKLNELLAIPLAIPFKGVEVCFLPSVKLIEDAVHLVMISLLSVDEALP